MKGIIFDVDGTLWDSTREVAVAWNKVLQDEMEGHEILTAEGLQKEIWKADGCDCRKSLSGNV